MNPVQALRDYAAADYGPNTDMYGPPIGERYHAIDRWMHHLIAVGRIPDEILEAMPEVSRHNDPQISPQEYECGCVTVTRVTDRNGCTWLGYDEKPFEMRLALPCDNAICELAHLRTMEK